MQHRPRKRFGQHFLADHGIIQTLINAIRPGCGDVLVEIGPGLGALTKPLLALVPHLEVIEIDRDLAEQWRRSPQSGQITVHEQDVLEFDFSLLPDRLRLAGNLPYNISTPLLFHLVRFADQIVDAHFMLQKEVVDRMVAAPGTRDYGRLSVMLQYHFHMEALFDVPPEAFDPPPKVNSSVVRLTPKRPVAPEAKHLETLEALVTQAFSQRRKMLRSSLRHTISQQVFEELGIDVTRRAESLSLEEFVALANAC